MQHFEDVAIDDGATKSSRPLRRRAPQAYLTTQTSTYKDADGYYIFAENVDTGVRSVIQTGPPEKITDPALYSQGVVAYRALLGTEGEAERNFKGFRRREYAKAFFQRGRVFRTLWVQPEGEESSYVSAVELSDRNDKQADRIGSRVREFIVIRSGETYCTALPIVTYGRRGLSLPEITKFSHGIIYTGSYLSIA